MVVTCPGLLGTFLVIPSKVILRSPFTLTSVIVWRIKDVTPCEQGFESTEEGPRAQVRNGKQRRFAQSSAGHGAGVGGMVSGGTGKFRGEGAATP